MLQPLPKIKNDEGISHLEVDLFSSEVFRDDARNSGAAAEFENFGFLADDVEIDAWRQERRQVDGALPDFKAAFVNAGYLGAMKNIHFDTLMLI